MGLVDDDRVVAAQLAVAGDLGEQDAVGHHLDPCLAAGLPGEPDLVADQFAQLDAEFVGDPSGHAASRDPPRLGVSYPAAAGSQADLRQLGGLAGARLAGHHDHLVVADQFGDLVHVRADRQPLVVLDPRLGDDGGLGHLAGQPRPPYDPTLAPHRAGSPATCAQRVPNTEVVPHEFARDHCQG